MQYLNISDLSAPGWRFLEPYCDAPQLSWETFSGQPANRVERRITRPALGRYRACLSAVRAAQRHKDAVLVSHLPNVTLATALLARALAPAAPHVAFAFNYTDLPTGRRLELARRGFRHVREFVVFSRYEIDLYARLFDLPPGRFTYLPWAMEAPAVATHHPRPFPGPYLSAIGGEGRDYQVLAAAMRRLPQHRMVVVARPASLVGIAFPDNVTVHTNLPAPVTWAIAAHSAGMAIPLRSDRTPNGHVSIVGAQHLGIPLVVTRSDGVRDYVDDRTAQMVTAGEVTEMARALDALIEAPQDARHRADLAQAQARHSNSLSTWCAYFEDLDARLTSA